MANQPDKSDQNPLKYKIAEPKAYSAYPLDVAPRQPVGIGTAAFGSGEPGPSRGPWDIGSELRGVVSGVGSDVLSNLVSPDQPKVVVTASGVSTVETRAIWVVHGMGQQVPFETVDRLAQGILGALKERGTTLACDPQLRTVKIAGQVMQRVEISFQRADASGKRNDCELHLYETYWAPDTEGVARLKDVMSFLWDGGTRGILNCFKPFQRAMFDDIARFKIPKRSAFFLCVTLLVLIALTVINGVIVASAAAKTKLVQVPSLTSHWPELAAIASCMVAVAFTLGIVLFLADFCRPERLKRGWQRFISWIGWASVIVTVVQILVTALLMTALIHLDWLSGHPYAPVTGGTVSSWLAGFFSWVSYFFAGLPDEQLQAFSTCIIIGGALLVGLAMTISAVLRSSEKSLRGHWSVALLVPIALAANVAAVVWPIGICFRGDRTIELPSYLWFLGSSIWVFPFLSFFSAQVRELMIQYVGDVAIYVRPNKLDRFNQVRNEIKEAARLAASAIFTAYDESETKFLYDQVALVGHSLGSVIAYDTLDRLMMDDSLTKNALQVSDRTKALVTFGSPLNKTAFFFTIQAKDSLHIRERLAATVQPLITSYQRFRNLAWINVYSPHDIISGSLRFYDWPGTHIPPAVDNIADPDACVPLLAHNSYWTNPTVWRALLGQIAP
jgi:hypothetical protein